MTDEPRILTLDDEAPIHNCPLCDMHITTELDLADGIRDRLRHGCRDLAHAERALALVRRRIRLFEVPLADYVWGPRRLAQLRDQERQIRAAMRRIRSQMTALIDAAPEADHSSLGDLWAR